MIVRLDTHRLQTLDQVREFLDGSEQVDLQPQTRADAYAFVAKTVRRFDYALRGRADKGLLRRFLAKAAGLSRAQITRLLQQHRTTGEIADRRGAPRRPFPRRYSNADIGLLAELDVLHGTLSGPATRKLCARAFHLFGDRRFERLAGISNGHLYNLRHTTSYQRRRGTPPLPTRPVQVAIGERRRPQPFGQPGWVRVDTVHQGDLDGMFPRCDPDRRHLPRQKPPLGRRQGHLHTRVRQDPGRSGPRKRAGTRATPTTCAREGGSDGSRQANLLPELT